MSLISSISTIYRIKKNTMAKDFKSRIGSKRLNTLIPDTDPSPAPIPVVIEEPKQV